MADVQATICDEAKCTNQAVLSVVWTVGKGAKRKDYCHAHVLSAVRWLQKLNKKVHE